MRRARMLLARIAAVFGSRRRDHELDEELQAHLAFLADEHERRGLTRAEAEQAARRDLGGLVRTREAYRDQQGLPFFDALRQDLRYAFRMWRHSPGFNLVVVLVLALGIGANSAMFTFVNAMLFRPLAGRAGDLIGVYSHNPAEGRSYRMFSYPAYRDVVERADIFDDVVAFTFAQVGRPSGDEMNRVLGQVVSSNYFSALGVSLAAGRAFTAAEERPGAELPVAIAPYAAWQATGFDPAYVGRTIRVNTRDFTVVGVAPKGFTGTIALFGPDVWLPLGVFDTIVRGAFNEQGRGLGDRRNSSLMLAGLLKPGVTLEAANARLAVLSTDLERAFPVENDHQILTVHPMSRVNLSSSPTTDRGPAVLSAVLMPLSGGVLLIACLNIANMLLARGTARKKEIAIRLALGGGRSRVVRQLLTENLVLAALGASLGVAGGAWTLHVVMATLTPVSPVPILVGVWPDLNVVLVAVGATVLSTLAFGLAPALKLTRPQLVGDLKDLGGSMAGPRRLHARGWLVVCQIAVSLMLLTAGGLFARAALRAGAADPGYRFDHLLLVSIDSDLAGYDTALGRERFQAAFDRLRRLPGVVSVGAATQVPFGDSHEGRTIVRPGRADALGTAPTYTGVTSGYFRAVGLPILHGRDFTLAETNAASPVNTAIIDEPLAHALFGAEDPIGQTVEVPPGPTGVATGENAPKTIVGIVPGIRDQLFTQTVNGHLYVPASALVRGTMHFNVRTAGGSDGEMLAAIRRELHAADERLPVIQLRTMSDFHQRGILLWVIRAAGQTLSVLGALALLLAVIGVYGVKSFAVAQRTREIGVRLALGARPFDIAWLLVRDGARVTLLGIAIGFPLALGLAKVLSNAIFEVSAFDPLVLTLAPLVLAAAAGLATYLPARRGMRVSPLTALRTE